MADRSRTTDAEQAVLGTSDPSTGEMTSAQAARAGLLYGYGGQVEGFREPPPGTYGTYRRIVSDPTVALARAIFSGPIVLNSWVVNAREDASEEAKQLIEETILPQRPVFVPEALRAIDHGWKPFEKVWEVRERQLVLRKLKSLLPDKTKIKTDEYGTFAGIEQDKTYLPPNKCLVVTNDGEAGNYYGRSRCENIRGIWSKGQQTDEKGAQLTTKVAAIVPIVHYPDGTSFDERGAEMPNYEAAKRILTQLSCGQGIAVKNLFASTDDPQLQAELAGKGSWVISFLEAASAASSLAGMTDRQRYYDTLKVRGWLMPERAVTEAITAGSRADSEQQTTSALGQAIHADKEIARHISWYAVDDVLTLNFGEQARGSVWVEPAPLTDELKAVFSRLLDAVLNNPGTLEEALIQTDMNAVWDALEIPKKNKTVDFSAVQDPQPQPDPNADPDNPGLTPEQQAAMQKAYASVRKDGGGNSGTGAS